MFIIPSCLQSFLELLLFTLCLLVFKLSLWEQATRCRHITWSVAHTAQHGPFCLEDTNTLNPGFEYLCICPLNMILHKLCDKTWVCHQLFEGFRPVNGADLNWTQGPLWESGTWLSRCRCFWVQVLFDTKCHGLWYCTCLCDTGLSLYNFLQPEERDRKESR